MDEIKLNKQQLANIFHRFYLSEEFEALLDFDGPVELHKVEEQLIKFLAINGIM